MATSEVYSSETNHKMAPIQALLRGQKYAKELQILLAKPIDHQDGAVDFVEKILSSFSEGIDRIKGQMPLNYQNKCRKRKNSDHLQKYDKRGCYNRRRSSETRIEVSPTMEDGQAWRKYGQKVILNSKFPRSYFRCTHKFDQGCKATKQVQILEDNLHLYQTTYIGFHTCRDALKGCPALFASETELNQQINLAVKEEEHKEQDSKSDLTDNIHSSFLRSDMVDLSDSVSQMYSCFGGLDDVTSQFDHGNFQMGHFFFGGDDDEGEFSQNLYTDGYGGRTVK